MKRLIALVLFALVGTGAIAAGIQLDTLLAGVTDNNGEMLSGGKLYSYDAGTVASKTLYQEASLSTPHSNPIVLDAYGRKVAFGSGKYKLILKTSDDATLWTADGVDLTDPAPIASDVASLTAYTTTQIGSLTTSLASTTAYVLSLVIPADVSALLTAHIASSTGVHGLIATESVVGTWSPQTLRAKTLESCAASTNFSFGGFQGVSLATPTAATDAVNKGYLTQSGVGLPGSFVGGYESESYTTSTTFSGATAYTSLVASITVTDGESWMVWWYPRFSSGPNSGITATFTPQIRSNSGIIDYSGPVQFYMKDNGDFWYPVYHFGITASQSVTFSVGMSVDATTASFSVFPGRLVAMKFKTP